MAYRLEPFIASRAYDPEADILPTWTGKLRVHYQVKKMVNRFWERLWEMKASIEVRACLPACVFLLGSERRLTHPPHFNNYQ